MIAAFAEAFCRWLSWRLNGFDNRWRVNGQRGLIQYPKPGIDKMSNAYILEWTMDEYDRLKQELADAGFVFQQEGQTGHIRADVPFEQVDIFGELCRKHLNAPVNYVDIQYPERRTTVIVFQQTTHFITNREQNEQVRAWAIALGLPPEQADWDTSF
jgi:hypothetical protein